MKISLFTTPGNTHTLRFGNFSIANSQQIRHFSLALLSCCVVTKKPINGFAFFTSLLHLSVSAAPTTLFHFESFAVSFPIRAGKSFPSQWTVCTWLQMHLQHLQESESSARRTHTHSLSTASESFTLCVLRGTLRRFFPSIGYFALGCTRDCAPYFHGKPCSCCRFRQGSFSNACDEFFLLF